MQELAVALLSVFTTSAAASGSAAVSALLPNTLELEYVDNYSNIVSNLSIHHRFNVPNVTLNNGINIPAVSFGTFRLTDPETYVEVNLTLQSENPPSIDTSLDYSNQGAVLASVNATGTFYPANFFLTSKIDPGASPTTNVTARSAPACTSNDCSSNSMSKSLPNPDMVGTGTATPDTLSSPATAFNLSTAYQRTKYQFLISLQSLGIPYIDLMLVHYSVPSCAVNREVWRAMEDLYHAGKARAIGVSNFCPSTLECIATTATVVPAVNQVQYHVGMGRDPGGIKSYCEAHDIQLQAYSVNGNDAGSLVNNPKLAAIGARHGNRSAVAVAQRWAWQNGVPIITTTTSAAQLEETLHIFEFELTGEEMAELDTVGAAGARVDNYSLTCSK